MPDIFEKVFNNSLNTCEYISGYKNKNSLITVKCLIHNNTFTTKYENVARDNRKHHICPQCQQEDRNKKYANVRTELTCAYCGKKFIRNKSHQRAKSDLYFCSRECKDKAQSLQSGDNFKSLRPEHYGSLFGDYRKLAFKNYPHKCAVCGYDEDERILQVHHKDENREHNNLENLIILCPNCHWKITLHLYTLTEENILLPI